MKSKTDRQNKQTDKTDREMRGYERVRLWHSFHNGGQPTSLHRRGGEGDHTCVRVRAYSIFACRGMNDGGGAFVLGDRGEGF